MTDQLAGLLDSCRIVDLSKKVHPGRACGRNEDDHRKYVLTRLTLAPGEIRHEVLMENHISTHVEAPAHIMSTAHRVRGKDVSEMPLERFYGSAVLVNLAECPPSTEVRSKEIKAAGARKGDIVLFGNSPHKGEKRPYLGEEVARFLVKLSPKAVGVDDTVFPENPAVTGKNLEKYYIHDLLLSNEIPIIEGLANLGALGCKRFVFFGLPPAMGGCDAFPIRAVALIE